MKKVFKILIATVGVCLLSLTCVACSQASTFVDQLFCAHEYDDGLITKEATCYEKGEITKTCSLCEKTVIEYIDKTAHTPVLVEAKVPTCDEPGCTDGTVCVVCDAVITGFQEVPALGHKVEIDKGYEATCLVDGLSDGMHCTRCNNVLVEQSVIVARGHKLVNVTAKESTCSEVGYTAHVQCDLCAAKFGYEEFAKLAHTYVDGNTCKVCGEVPASEYFNDESLFSSAEVVVGESYQLTGNTLRVKREGNNIQLFTFSFQIDNYIVNLNMSDDSCTEVSPENRGFTITALPMDYMPPIPQGNPVEVDAENSGFSIYSDAEYYYITFPETFVLCAGSTSEKVITTTDMFTASTGVGTPNFVIYSPIN